MRKKTREGCIARQLMEEIVIIAIVYGGIPP